MLAFGCAEEVSDNEEDFLESVTALERDLEFESQVYLPLGSADAVIQSAINTQTKTALGSLLHSSISVNTTELRTSDSSSWVREEVDVFKDNSRTKSKRMLRVRYKYTDKAVMPKAFAKRTAFPLAVLAQPEFSVNAKLRGVCTASDSHAASSPLWYVLDTALSKCQSLIDAEQEAVRSASAKLEDPNKEIAESELNRIFFPIRATMRPTAKSAIKTYPEYDKLFAGGVEAGKLVIGLVNGRIDDSVPFANDPRWNDYFDELALIAKTHKFSLVSADGLSPEELLGPSPSLDALATKRFDTAFRTKIASKWLVFEAPVRVKIGREAERDFVIKLQTNFGDMAAIKRGVKTSDVFVYDGHSYLGGGPMSPRNYTSSDFPKSYQVLWFDSCLSYTYYDKDYFPLKKLAAGTLTGMEAMEVIANGLEAPSYKSGAAVGALLAGLIGGTQPSYEQLLTRALSTDSLRVVDGDLDNRYKPAKTPISLKDR